MKMKMKGRTPTVESKDKISIIPHLTLIWLLSFRYNIANKIEKIYPFNVAMFAITLFASGPQCTIRCHVES